MKETSQVWETRTSLFLDGDLWLRHVNAYMRIVGGIHVEAHSHKAGSAVRTK